jgi:hypothetical protein
MQDRYKKFTCPGFPAFFNITLTVLFSGVSLALDERSARVFDANKLWFIFNGTGYWEQLPDLQG